MDRGNPRDAGEGDARQRAFVFPFIMEEDKPVLQKQGANRLLFLRSKKKPCPANPQHSIVGRADPGAPRSSAKDKPPRSANSQPSHCRERACPFRAAHGLTWQSPGENRPQRHTSGGNVTLAIFCRTWYDSGKKAGEGCRPCFLWARSTSAYTAA